jgi:hypothetical protein
LSILFTCVRISSFIGGVKRFAYGRMLCGSAPGTSGSFMARILDGSEMSGEKMSVSSLKPNSRLSAASCSWNLAAAGSDVLSASTTRSVTTLLRQLR